jgi:hypothetical protein
MSIMLVDLHEYFFFWCDNLPREILRAARAGDTRSGLRCSNHSGAGRSRSATATGRIARVKPATRDDVLRYRRPLHQMSMQEGLAGRTHGERGGNHGVVAQGPLQIHVQNRHRAS